MVNKLPKISVVVVSYNGAKWIEKCLVSVLGSDYPKDRLEVIFVDNGSVDNSIGICKKLKSSVDRRGMIKLVNIPKNAGWSGGNNVGMKVASGEIIVCLSNDMEVDRQWVRQIADLMGSDPCIGVVQCNSLSMRDRKSLDSSMNYLDRFGYSYSYAPQKKQFEVFFAEGMAFAIKKEVIEHIGMLDAEYFMEYDDMDFSWRARLAGYKIMFCPGSIVYHARGGTVGATFFDRMPNVTWYTRNHFATLIKNYSEWELLQALPVVAVIELLKAFYIGFAKRNARLMGAILIGLKQVVLGFGSMAKRRARVQSIRRLTDHEIRKKMHPFRPKLQLSFINAQKAGRRFVIESVPPIRLSSSEVQSDE